MSSIFRISRAVSTKSILPRYVSALGLRTFASPNRDLYHRQQIKTNQHAQFLKSASSSSDFVRHMSQSTQKVQDLINNSKKNVFVFIKGTREEQACGYSAAVVRILEAYDADYDTFNVLDDETIRNEVKTYSNWPTIPQIYINKNFIGGCDILIEMHQNGELEKMLEGAKEV